MENNQTNNIMARVRRTLRLTAIAIILCATGFINVTRHSTIRTVDMLPILALGIAIGACIANIAFMLWLKKQSSNS